MIRFRVIKGVARLGQGQVMRLSGEQIKARAHALVLPDGYALGAATPAKDKPPALAPATVTAKAPVEFIAGEVIELPALPPHLNGMLFDMDEAARKANEEAEAARHKAMPLSQRKATG